MSMRKTLSLRRSRGFSLVELMVALTLSLLLMAGALSILYSSKVTYSENERIARLQESGRTVVELMLRDTRPAGYLGCSRPVVGDEFSNGLNSSASVQWNYKDPVAGFEATGATWSPALDATATPSATAGSDVLLVRTTRQGEPIFRTNAPIINATSAIPVDRDPGTSVPVNTPMVISDCEGSSVFNATGFTAAAAGPLGESRATISHAMGGPAGTNVSDSLTRGFTIGALVMPMKPVAYYVSPSVGGVGPALWQHVANDAPQELIEGVENIQVQFGIDTDNDLLVNQYVTADLVTDWSQVIAVTVAVLVRSPEEDGLEVDSRVYTLLDKQLGPFNDRRQRSVFTTTVVLRNRTQ